MSTNLTEIKTQTVDAVENRIKELQNTGDIDLPEDYSVGNALKSAWLKLQEIKDKKKNPVLESCSRISIQNALFDTVVQGLSPAKDQVYFIAYGSTLTAMRSYFGNMALAKRVDDDIEDIWATIIYQGDEVEVEIKRGKRFVVSHKSKWGNQNDDKVAGVYATAAYSEDSGKPDKQVLMTLSECKKAWSQGNFNPNSNYQGPHDKFTAEMAKKTAINRLTKPIIKSSSDSYLFKKSLDRSDDLKTDNEVQQEIKENANGETITIDVEEEEPKQVESPKEEPKKESAEEIYDNFDKNSDEPF
jgi:recombination protein RecT